MPVDFFHNETRYEPHSNDTFNLRYWFDDTYYKPGGPVFVLLGGETDGEGRLPFLQKGIVHQVIKATNGLGVILEHRYYGKSFPVPDLTTKNMRFLTTEQSLAEIDYFARNVSSKVSMRTLQLQTRPGSSTADLTRELRLLSCV